MNQLPKIVVLFAGIASFTVCTVVLLFHLIGMIVLSLTRTLPAATIFALGLALAHYPAWGQGEVVGDAINALMKISLDEASTLMIFSIILISGSVLILEVITGKMNGVTNRVGEFSQIFEEGLLQGIAFCYCGSILWLNKLGLWRINNGQEINL